MGRMPECRVAPLERALPAIRMAFAGLGPLSLIYTNPLEPT